MLDDAKKAVEDLMTAFDEFKSTNDDRLKAIEKKGTADPLINEKLGRLESSIASMEGLNQRVTQAEAKAKQLEETNKQTEALMAQVEAKLGRPGNREAGASLKTRVNEWGRAVFNAFAHGMPNLSEEGRKAISDTVAECKALSITPDSAGGYLAPVEFVQEITKAETLLSPVRSLVRIRSTANKLVQIPKRTGQFSAKRVGEKQARNETPGLAYGLDELNLPEMIAIIDISNQMLEDSAFDMEGEIRGEASEQFAVREGYEFVQGGGGSVNEMEGILVNSDIGFTNSGSATTIADATGQADGLLALKYAIKTAYARNANWVLNRTTLGSVRKLKDTNKQYIWMPGLQNGAPNTIDGDPYVECPDMPNEGAGLFPIAYGDFKRAYTMADRIAMEMLRDPYTQADSGNIRFWLRKRVGGKVILAEAIRKLKCA